MVVPLEIVNELPAHRREFIHFAARYKNTERIRELIAHYEHTPPEIAQIRGWLERYGVLKASEQKEINHAKALA